MFASGRWSGSIFGSSMCDPDAEDKCLSAACDVECKPTRLTHQIKNNSSTLVCSAGRYRIQYKDELAYDVVVLESTDGHTLFDLSAISGDLDVAYAAAVVADPTAVPPTALVRIANKSRHAAYVVTYPDASAAPPVDPAVCVAHPKIENVSCSMGVRSRETVDLVYNTLDRNWLVVRRGNV
jgi:hypothetical protein